MIFHSFSSLSELKAEQRELINIQLTYEMIFHSFSLISACTRTESIFIEATSRAGQSWVPSFLSFAYSSDFGS